MWNYSNSNELYHHGVKGMKWGKRKAKIAQKYDKLASKNYEAYAEYRRSRKYDSKKGGFVGGGRAYAKHVKLESKISKLQEQAKKSGITLSNTVEYKKGKEYVTTMMNGSKIRTFATN